MNFDPAKFVNGLGTAGLLLFIVIVVISIVSCVTGEYWWR